MSDIPPLVPNLGDYVLATKYDDGDPGDPWAVGFYGGLNDGDRHGVKDEAGLWIYGGNRFRRVGRVTAEIGNWLMSNAELLERAPSKINLWGMYDWEFVNEIVIEQTP